MKTLYFYRTLVSFCFFFFAKVCLGIELENFKYYDVENGLASNTVQDIIQDSDGYIWMVAEKDLSRFDGYEFKNYRCTPRNSSSFNSSHFSSIFEDGNKKLWLGTGDGVFVYDLRTETFESFACKTGSGKRVEGRVHEIFSDENGNMWINATHSGAFYFDSNTRSLHQFSFEEYRNIPTESVFLTCIYRDKDDNIWASVSNSIHQVYVFNKAEKRFVPAFSDAEIRLRRLRSYSILEDSFGTLWLGTWEDGLYAVEKKTRTIKGHYLHTENVDKILHIHTIAEYEPGQLLIGSNDGLTHFITSPISGNRIGKHVKEPVLSSRFVYSICKDREGGLWLGTYYGGVNYTAPNRTVFSAYSPHRHENSVSGNVVSVFCEDKDGNLWIGTDDAGLNFFDPKIGKFTHYKPEKTKNSLSFHNVHALCIDANTLWIGTYTGGLNVMDLHTGRFKQYYSSPADLASINSNSVYSLFKDSRGSIWVGTISGICRYVRSTDNFERFGKTEKMIVDICQQGNVIWFATNDDGLFSYDLKTEKWTHYLYKPTDKRSIISNDVASLCVDTKNVLWVGTENGLCRYDPGTDSFVVADIHLPGHSISKILCDNDNLWITTSKGLLCYAPGTGRVRTFTQSDGLLSEFFITNSGIKTRSGKIYVGTAKGFNAFYPGDLVENKKIPLIGITDFQLFNKSVNMNEYLVKKENGIPEIRLPYNKNSFSFEYTALSYLAPAKNQYAFMLEGFEKEWNEVGNLRKATYTNIPPGEYYFRVRASNNDGVWNETGQTIKVVLVPPFWWNNWSVSFYILVLIASFIFFMKYRLKKEQKKKEEEIAKLKGEQEKEAYHSKINFFTTIAHEIRTPVSLIIGPLEKIVEKSDQLPANVTNDLQTIDRNSQRLLTLVNQILDFQKIEKEEIRLSFATQNVNELLTGIYNRFKPFVEYKNIEFIYESGNEDFSTGIDAENLTKIISNLLNNASKYARNYIKLALHVRVSENRFEITVSDNGPGIPPAEQEKIFRSFYQIPGKHVSGTGIGLYLVKSIVDAWGGEIKLDSEEGKGLHFSVLFPFIRAEDAERVPTSKEEPAKQAEGEKMLLDDSSERPTVLIVEDNIDMQLFIQESLMATYNVLIAGTGVEGINILKKNEIDLIISDIMMPGMDGIEFCNYVKSSQLWNHIPFILLTAKTNISTKIEALEIGADAYIEKPFLLSYLVAQIRNLMDSRKNLMEKFSKTPYVPLKSIAGNKSDEDFLLRTNEIIEQNISNAYFTIEQLGEKLHISNSGLFAKIKNLTGITPNKLLLLMRLKKATELLMENKYRVNEICYKVGFNSPSYFAKCFQKQYGVLPKDFLNTVQKGEHDHNTE